ncbi:Multidrug efflux pump subunit AcrA [Candidatus Bealeia paramacronuclearis]|uniref:Multidrug efflux pump subunit AcrA n=1 Tax=Candidatus Bealeia paramacronuclearis TaxID=1921001 RepID=A0ABZ2C2T3_9PROT|nr:Multidrug efflux pump subunit AcrA [Candidatus Bealeia paramacronuclearis]
MKTYQKIILAAVVAGAGFGAFQYFFVHKKTMDLPQKEAVPVEVTIAKTATITNRVKSSGILTANQSVSIRPEVSGQIAEILFEEGQEVKKGAPLYKISDALYKAKVKEAEAQVALSREEYRRATSLLEKKFGTLQNRDKALATLQVNEAQLDEAKIKLEDTIIKAPFEGVMGISNVSVGALVSEQTELVNLVDLTPINVDFNVPESLLGKIKPGDVVDATIADYDILPMDATIKALAPEVDPATHTIKIRATLPNTDLKLRPGLYAHMSIAAGEIKNAVLIPETAIELEDGEPVVFVVMDKIAIRTVVSTGMKDGKMVEVTNGLKEGDTIVINGQFRLHDGDEVAVMEEQKK